MAKKRRKTPSSRTAKNLPKGLQIIEYEVTTEPIEERRYNLLPDHVKYAFERLHEEAQVQPLKTIPELLRWIEEYPDIPMLYNYLSVAYSRSGQRKKAEEAIQGNYRRNPDYLFARLNYAELCLARRDYDKVAEIFEHKFDLKLLYPERNRFHVSEVTNFMGITGIYFCGIGERQAAQSCFDVLKQLAPDHPMTMMLSLKLSPDTLQSLIRCVMENRKKPL
jgi:tetratricopeptide (TPR) repeat protein